MALKLFQRVSQAPTKPQAAPGPKPFDVAELYNGPAPTTNGPESSASLALDEKLRQAYFWIVNNAIISPFYDIEYQDGPAPSFVLGDQHCSVTLPSGQSYSSFVLLPLLNFAVRRKCLFIGGPGRGKTASAILMGVLAGYSLREVQRAIQKGQPQMTVSDLLGTPIPSDLVSAKSLDQIGIAWRKWLGMRIKIIDEYNRIPTRTQSALLTVMADNYAEVLDQTFECPEAAWYLTANDDAGGGTYQVIEALKDRIDIVVKALHFNTRFIGELLDRVEKGIRPEALVPAQVIFAEREWDQMYQDILAVKLPDGLLRRFEFFASQFEFCEPAAIQFEYKTKDTVKLSGTEFDQLAAAETGKDKVKDLGSQTRNGLSVRAIMTALTFIKAMAYFRGSGEVSIEDMRQILPFVLHDKLASDRDAPYFEGDGNAPLRIDKISWLRRLFDLSCAEFDRLGRDKEDPVGALSAQFAKGLDGVKEKDVRAELVKIERLLSEWSRGRKLYGHMYDDVLKLKYLHQRYTNYLKWLVWKG
jgi:MoxR-like ATPase